MRSATWRLACHLNYGNSGKVAVIQPSGDSFTVTPIDTCAAASSPPAQRPIFLGVNEDLTLRLFDQVTKQITSVAAFPPHADPSYAYVDQQNQRLWFVNDGDEQGVDALNCGLAGGSSVSLFDPQGGGSYLGTLCIDRGHHVAAFVPPHPSHPHRAPIAFVSSLLDGTIAVVGNDAADPATFLQVQSEINLCEPDKERTTATKPNNAFPHGMVYSSVTDKVYNLNNGYGTLVVLDPNSQQITQRIALKGCSNLLLSPDGRFAIGKGADRKTDPDHVTGIIAVVDLITERVVNTLKLNDIYPSTYRFNPSGTKLYVTSATTGTGTQHANLKKSSLLVYDATALPQLALLNEVEVGVADCGRRPIAFTQASSGANLVFVPNPTAGTLTILAGESDQVIATVTLGEANIEEVLFSFWNGHVQGC